MFLLFTVFDIPFVTVKNRVTVMADDHDWSILKAAASVTFTLNIGEDPGESLFSGGENGQGEITVSLHDSIFNPSTSRHHAVLMLGCLREKVQLVAENTTYVDNAAEITEEVVNKCMPYMVFLETSGGPDHNIKHWRNVLSLFTIFLVGNINKDKLCAAYGCPGHSYLNTVERCMSILNLGLTNLSLTMDPEAPEWFHDFLNGNNSMK